MYNRTEHINDVSEERKKERKERKYHGEPGLGDGGLLAQCINAVGEGVACQGSGGGEGEDLSSSSPS